MIYYCARFCHKVKDAKAAKKKNVNFIERHCEFSKPSL